MSSALLDSLDGELDEFGIRSSVKTGRSVEKKKDLATGPPPDKLTALGINNRDLGALREWVTKPTERNLPSDTVAVMVTHSNLKQKMLELKFSLHTTVGALKERLYLHHGTPSASQRLVLRDGDIDLCAMDDDSRKLGYYSVQNGQTIHVIDIDPHSISRAGGLENTDLIQKYRMSDQDYEQRKGTVREWIREQRDKDPEWQPPKPNMMMNGLGGDNMNSTLNSTQQNPANVDATQFTLNARCQIAPGARRGSVAFVGDVPDIPGGGLWIGIRLDEPLGKHNGTIKGNFYFEAPDRHGTFVRPAHVTLGDFPERDYFDDEDDDEM
mmetsp:Transcript_16569/g.24893  ORF Transcript_16569/g.24893 Transcript_16569/m.24893 type:complete len:325 (+) Transcript_16569:31-1005(+)